MEKKKYFLDIAHMHPVCPLSLSHARIFVLADVWARWKRKQGYSVRFPICMHYSGSTVFKITNVVSKFLQKQELNDAENKILKLIFDFYKIPKEQLHRFTDPIGVLDYFSNVILKDLKDIQVSCDYDDYFNTNSQLYREFVRAIFDIYAEKGFIAVHSRSLTYSNPTFRNPAIQRLNKTDFSPDTAKTMVVESLEKLDEKWSFARDDSIGTSMDGYVIDPMFDAEFLSILNAIFHCLKDFSVNESNARTIFKELLYKIENQDHEISPVTNELYRLAKEVLPVDIFFVERHLQNWVAKRIYTETILSPSIISTRQYFFLGSITKDGQVDSASRGHGITLPHLLEIASPVNARLALLYTFDSPWRNHKWESGIVDQWRKKTHKFINFYKILKNYSIEDYTPVYEILNKNSSPIEVLIGEGRFRKVLYILFDELPQIIYPLIGRMQTTPEEKKQKQIVLDFFIGYFEILCPVFNEKLYAK